MEKHRFIFLLLSFINLVLLIIRFRIVKRKKLPMLDPILIYHGMWVLSFFIKFLNLVRFNYTLSNSLPLLIFYWCSLALGLWLGNYIFRFKQVDLPKTYIDNRRIRYGFMSLILLIDFCGILLLVSIFRKGYPISALFSSRSFFNAAAIYKEITIMYILLAFLLVIYIDLLRFVSNVTEFLFLTFLVCFTPILIAAITAGRSVILFTIIIPLIGYFNSRRITSFSQKQIKVIILFLFVFLAVFIVFDMLRSGERVTLPNEKHFLDLIAYIQCPLDGFEFFNQDFWQPVKGYPFYYTFNFIFNQLEKIGINYGPVIDVFSLQSSLVKYDPVLVYSVGTMFMNFQNDFDKAGVFFVFLFGILTMYLYKRNYSEYNLFILIFTTLAEVQLLWSAQMYYMFGSSLFMFCLIWAVIISLLKRTKPRWGMQ